MGEVYRARDAALNRDVAIKVLPPLVALDGERLARFRREAQVLASLNHPHIAAIHGLDESTGAPALILELVEGPTLADRLSNGPLALDEALAVARQIAEAVEAAHEIGIVHRDLKPANIKAAPDARVKVLDFGLAKLVGPPDGGHDTGDRGVRLQPDPSLSPTITSPAMTRAGVILGTAAYMAPEQARGKAADKRADVWAFGCVLFETLTGTRAFGGAEVADVLANVLAREPEWSALPPATPPAIRHLLRRCLEKDPRRRLRDIGEARIALESPVSGAAETAALAARGLSARSRALVPIAAVAVTAIAAAALLWWRSTGPQTAPAAALRFTIPVPSGFEVLFGQMPSLAISPDGRTLVYQSNFQLHRRRLDRFDAEVIPGLEGFIYPFYSPDGRWLAFATQEGLAKAPAGGGLPVPILQTGGEQLNGASWGRNGQIVFARGIGNGGLWSVSEDGGQPRQITKVSEAANETQHVWPDVLPDGAVLYTVLGPSGDAQDARVVVEDVSRRTRTEVARGVSFGRYLESGHLLYVDGAGTVLVQPFDLPARRTTGPARSVLAGIRVATWGGGAALAVSASGTLVYATGTEHRNAKLVELDRAGAVRRQLGPPAAYGYLDLSPNGRTLATMVRAPGNDDIHLVDVATGQASRFSFEVSEDESPVWSPNGRRVAYSAAATGERRNIFIKALNSTEPPRLLYTGPRHLHLTSWSPDGHWLAFDDIGSGSNRVSILNVDDPSKLVTLPTAAAEGGAVFSPDGKWLAYHSADAPTGEVFVVSFPDLAGKQQVSRGGGARPRWSATGGTGLELYFVSYGPTAVQLSVAPATRREGAIAFQAPQRMFTLDASRGPIVTEIVPALDARSFFGVATNPDSPAREIRVVTNWLGEVLATNPSEVR